MASEGDAAGRRRSVSISVTLATGIGLLVLAAALTVFVIGWSVSRRNTVELLTEKADLILTTAEIRIRAHLDPALDQVGFVAGLVEDGTVDPADRPAMALLLTGAMAAAPQIATLGYLDRRLTLLGAQRRGERIEIFDVNLSFDSEIRAGAAELSQRTGAWWGEVVRGGPDQLAAVNLRQPLRRDGHLAGGLIALVTIQELSRFLGALTVSIEGEVPFILAGTDRVLAHPYLAQAPGPADGDPLPDVGEVGDPVLPGISGERRSPLIGSARVATRIVDTPEGDELVLLRPLEGYGEVPLTIGVHAPLQALSQEVDRLVRSGIAALAVLAVAVAAGIAMGRAIARPIRTLSAGASQIALFDFAAARPLPGSLFTELDDQAKAFNRMLSGLRWFETYVPRSLVKRLMADPTGAASASAEREVTVMFTDVGGFTSAAEAMPAQQAADLLNRHFAILAACVEAESGTIDKFIGDGLMAFWGAPERQDDHAARACRAALAIARAVDADNAAAPAAGRPAIRLRIGLHAGAAVVGNIGAPGRMNYTAVGDTVNIASRLEQLGKEVAGPAEHRVVVLASAAVLARLPAGIPAVSCGAHAIRGRQETLEVFRLETGTRAEPAAPSPSPGPSPRGRGE